MKNLSLYYISKLIKIALFILLLEGCAAVTPHQAEAEIPHHWREDLTLSPQTLNLNWWEQFCDPVLDAYIEEAICNNKDIQIAIARVFQFYQLWQITNSQLYPEIDAFFEYSRQQASLATIPPYGNILPRVTNDYNVFLSLFYNLDLWGRIQSASLAAKHDFYAQIYTQRDVVLNLISSLAAAYVQLRMYQEQMQISKSTLKSREEYLQIAQAQYESGLTSLLEVTQAKIEVEKARAALIQFQALIPQQENLLSILIGYPPSAVPESLNIEKLCLPQSIPGDLPSSLLYQRPDIQKAEQALIAANYRIDEARALYFPDISLTGVLGFQSVELSNLFSGRAAYWQYAVNGAQILFNAGKTSAQVYAADAVSQQAFYTYQQTVLNALKEVNDFLVGYKRSREQLEVQRELVKESKLYLELATLRYDNGETDYLNVLDAQRNLFIAQIDYITSYNNTFATLIGLYKAFGGGWVVKASTY